MQVPGNLQDTRGNAKVVDKLLRNPSIKRVAGFCSSGCSLKCQYHDE